MGPGIMQLGCIAISPTNNTAHNWRRPLAPWGYGFPAAIAAALEHPAKTVVCLAGDGCFQMTCNELSTAVQHGAAPIIIVMNNGRYGTIRMHQERTYPGRVSGTVLANPDFRRLSAGLRWVWRNRDGPGAVCGCLCAGPGGGGRLR